MLRTHAPWLRSLNGDGGYGLALLVVLALLAVLAAGGTPWLLALRYERAGIQQGEYWRWLTAHFVHLGVRHVLLDAAALLLLWSLYARELGAAGWLCVALCSMAAIDAGLWWWASDVQWYAGISGLLHGLWLAGAARSAWRREFLGLAMLAALLAKLSYEFYSASSVALAGLPVVLAAHRFGAAGGLVGLALWAGVHAARGGWARSATRL